MSAGKVTLGTERLKEDFSRKALYTNTYEERWWDVHTYFKNKTKRDRIASAIMMILVVVESTFLFIQAAHGFETQSAEDVDLAAFIILLVTNIAWMAYGFFVIHDFPVLLSGFLYTVGAVLVIITVILYGNQ